MPTTIVITSEELAKIEAPGLRDRPTKPSIPRWRRLASGLFILCPPLLFILCIVDLVRSIRKEPAERHAYAMHYWALLLACCVIWCIAVAGFALWGPNSSTVRVVSSSTITVALLPPNPSDDVLSGKDIAKHFLPLVVAIFNPEQPAFFVGDGNDIQVIGAGAIAYAEPHGFLVLTSRHVVDGLLTGSGIGQEVGVSLQDDQLALATVVGLHDHLDLALLWVGRDVGETEFLQSLRSFDSIEVGEQVYAIGHPGGLAYSISSGLVAQKRDGHLVQISAPISPGNSGGPVYDCHGRLVGIVQSVIDKSINPNAENLNFAVRVDDLFVPEAWTLADTGRAALETITAARLKASARAETTTDQIEAVLMD